MTPPFLDGDGVERVGHELRQVRLTLARFGELLPELRPVTFSVEDGVALLMAYWGPDDIGHRWTVFARAWGGEVSSLLTTEEVSDGWAVWRGKDRLGVAVWHGIRASFVFVADDGAEIHPGDGRALDDVLAALHRPMRRSA